VNRLAKIVMAAAAAIMPLGLWASPAHAAATTYNGYLNFTFTDTNGILQECDISADAQYDPVEKTLRVTTADPYEDTWCEVEETTVYVVYFDAANEQQRLLVRTSDGSADVRATGVAMNPSVTVVQDFLYCDGSANNTCSDGPTFNAYTAPK
jgi:hypothetical protein